MLSSPSYSIGLKQLALQDRRLLQHLQSQPKAAPTWNQPLWDWLPLGSGERSAQHTVGGTDPTVAILGQEGGMRPQGHEDGEVTWCQWG